MTNAEFSDTFTTLLNSYNTQAAFGEQASKREIVLDEYEKSVLLTQAQDIIVKSYFDGTLNSQGQGFDDSTRRQVDFSSLIKVGQLKEVTSDNTPFDDRGIIYRLPRKKDAQGNDYEDTTDVLFILNEKLTARKTTKIITVEKHYTQEEVTEWNENLEGAIIPNVSMTAEQATAYNEAISGANKQEGDTLTSEESYAYNLTLDGHITTDNTYQDFEYEYKDKDFIIVPINYKEYDREMSKPYAQPLKKQAWRLFQNQSTTFDVNSELIPNVNIQKVGNGTHIGDVQFFYKIRYVRRPQPIILEDLPDDLVIDGLSEASKCELNPILHMDILNKAVELAITTRGGGAAPSSNERDGQAGRR